ncbi:unnamed protein product [Cunninghamella blakesleeana]
MKNNNKENRFSGLSYEKVLSFLGIKHNILFSKDEDIDEKEINNEVIKRISTLLIVLTRTFGIVNSGNESKRKEFISTIIYNIVNEYYEKNVDILIKDYIDDDDDIKVPVEYVIVHKKYILIVIEAKKDDFDQDRAQLLMQLYNTYIKNIKNGAPKNHSIYGTVTAGYTWKFIWCKGNDNIKDIKDVKSNMIWNYKQQIHPIELYLEKDQEQ